MRQFVDDSADTWVASVARAEGGDYKGAFYLVMERSGGSGEPVALTDVRWNSTRTAERTLATMSSVELRRRLRSALGRAGVAASAS
ncbi:MAG: hypothetical protein OXN18_16130 [Gemmatimonadota bacterium]|nr:hypothetical protein [Gemmatimonadota bacterium]